MVSAVRNSLTIQFIYKIPTIHYTYSHLKKKTTLNFPSLDNSIPKEWHIRNTPVNGVRLTL